MAVLRSPRARSAGLSRARISRPRRTSRAAGITSFPQPASRAAWCTGSKPECWTRCPATKIRYSSWTEQVGGLGKLAGRRAPRRHAVFAELRHPVRLDGGCGHHRTGAQHWAWRWSAPPNSSSISKRAGSPEALESHLEAGRRVDRVRAQAFDMIREGHAQRAAHCRNSQSSNSCSKVSPSGPVHRSRARSWE